MPQCRGVAGQLADVVDVVDQAVERDAGALRRRLAAHPAGHDHPGVEGGADDRAAGDELAELVVVELAVVVDDRAAVRVAGPHRPAEMIERVAEALVAEMRGIENHAEPIHLAHELAAARAEVSLRVGALCVDAWPVVARAHRPQPVSIGAFQVTDGHERVGAFEAEDVADRAISPAGHASQMLVERRPRPSPARARRALPWRGTTRAAPASSPTPARVSASPETDARGVE